MADFVPAPIKPTVGIAALEALDIRVGTIESVEEIPRSDKLMKLTVNFGDHFRTILAGIKKGAPIRAKSRAVRLCLRLIWSRAKWRVKLRRHALRYRLCRQRYARSRGPGASCSQRHSRRLSIFSANNLTSLLSASAPPN